MENKKSGKDLILRALEEKSIVKQDIYDITQEIFNNFKRSLNDLENELSPKVQDMDNRLKLIYRDDSEQRADIQFAGDVLVFSMHTNIFNFNDTHAIYQTDYIKEDISRTYCGMIQIHNFLADTFKYDRHFDVGYLIARIFINKERHFFVEGKRQLGFLYNDLANAVINDVYIKAIIESAILYSIDFDLLVPPYQEIKEITLKEMNNLTANAGFRTGKRLGFQFNFEDEEAGPE